MRRKLHKNLDEFPEEGLNQSFAKRADEFNRRLHKLTKVAGKAGQVRKSFGRNPSATSLKSYAKRKY